MDKSFSVFVLLVALFALVRSAEADSWLLPKESTVCSKNNRYCLKVIPKKLESQLSYFADKVNGRDEAGGDKKVKDNFCKGIFYMRDANGILRKRWQTKLVNEVAPVDVLVSDRGDYVVTFDNWHSVGYGDDVVAIYETSSGALVKKLGLSDFLTDSDIDNLPHTTSSIWWGGDHWIDRDKNHLVLRVTKGKRSFEQNAEYFEVRIELSTGRVLDEKRDRLPSLQFLIEPVTDDEEPSPASTGGPTDGDCSKEGQHRTTSSTELLMMVTAQEKPVYRAAAKAVRATGRVVVEIMIGSDGNVECAQAISGHPLLKHSVLEAVRNWKFKNGGERIRGRIAFDSKVILVSPEGEVIK